MAANLLVAALLVSAIMAVSACATRAIWKCEVQRYGNRVVVNECHQIGHQDASAQ